MRYLLKLSNTYGLMGFLLLIIVSGCSQKQNSNTNKKQGRTVDFTGEVTFLTAAGDSITTIEAAVADDQEKRNEGLMDVNSLPENRGMLFIFENEQPLSFWMANTPLSLDIIFVNSEKKIVRIHQNTQPFAEKNFNSEKPAIFVVETNGGFCLSHDIREGMRIAF